MKRFWSRWAVFNLVVGDLVVCHLIATPAAIAQIVSDPTLPTPSDVVATPAGVTINGGTVRGSNLFHSFDQFSVATGSEAYFNNAGAIANIISRVTGNQVSSINGLIRANGTANLFLLNPNGIILGPNARLDIGGSFLASTADRVLFENGFAFSASTPQAPPLLTINAPIGLQYGTTPGAIRTQVGTNGRSAQLQVASGQMLGLLGGDLTLTGATLNAPQGRVELGSVRGNGVVTLTPLLAGFAANYGQVTQFGSVLLTGQSTVDTSGVSSGVIRVWGDRVQLNQASSLVSDTLGNGSGGRIEIEANRLDLSEGAFIASASLGGGKAADIAVSLTNALTITGELSDITLEGLLTGKGRLFNRRNGIITATSTPGIAGNVTIKADTITLRNSAGIVSDTFGAGNAGNVTIRTAGAVSLSHNSAISSSTAGGGNAGNIRLNIQSLTVQRGGGVIGNSIGSGRSGDILINASDDVMVLDSVRGDLFPTSIVSATSFLGGNGFVSRGEGGDVTINTGRLVVRGGAVVSSSSGGFLINGITAPDGGDAGNLTINATESVEVSGISADGQFPSLINSTTSSRGAAGIVRINTQRLIAQGGGQVSVSTAGLGAGQGGQLDIVASDQIVLRGVGERLIQTPQGPELRQSDSGLVATAGLPFFSAPSDSTAGDIRVTTGELIIQDNAALAVSSSESADGGNVSVSANTILLERGGRITAATGSGQGGNVRLATSTLLLRRDSQVSAEASARGNGGNILIDANFVVSPARENGDILANANQGDGGNINIRAQGIFGLVQSDGTPFSDISASSKFGVDGVIEITTLDTDPSRGLVTLPTGVVDVSGLVAQDCSNQSTAIARESGEFTISGRGGIPAAPTDMLNGEALFVDWETPPASTPTPAAATSLAPAQHRTLSATIVEAQGWQVNSDGNVVLMTQAASTIPHGAGIRAASCSDLNS